MTFPQRSGKSFAIKDLFYSKLTLFHFFIEDENQENLYEVIINRLFPTLDSFKVFPLNGKQNILKHASAGHRKVAEETRIYLLDKDFDDLLGVLDPDPQIFYLDDFSIETSLIDQNSIEQIAVEESPRIHRERSTELIDYENVLKNWLPSLTRLHRAFFLVQKHDLGIKNTSEPPERFCKDSQPHTICQQKIEDYEKRVAAELEKMGLIESEADYMDFSAGVFGHGEIYMSHINGKFIIRLFNHWLRKLNLIRNLTVDSTTIRLAMHSELERLTNLRERITAHIS